MPKFVPPYLGAAYYPEVWPMEQVDEDIALMKQAGVNLARMAEFAWSRMEPSDGRFDFAWLHTVVDKLGKAGIASVLGTPSAAPPLWLTSKHPEVLYHREDGTTATHGSRVHFCPNNPAYRDYCARIAEKMGREFGKDGNVIGWQVDNEVSPGERPCVCAVCVKKFHAWLEERFGGIAALNDAWVTGLWSQTYASFSEIPIPRKDIWHHPSLLHAWAEFASDSYVDYVRQQADVLHRHVTQPVGTDMMCWCGVDYHDMHRGLDLVQHNHYHGASGLHEAIFWFDFCRSTLPGKPFWVTETATCWNGATTANGYKEPGFCRANSWLPIALGAEANCYWLWRQHRAGQELMHGAVVTSHGRPMHIMGEVQEIARGFEKAGGFLRGTAPSNTGLAVHFSPKAHQMYAHQPVVNKFNYAWGAMEKAWLPLLESQLRFDAIEPPADLSPYRALFSPFLPMLDEGGLRGRLRRWIEAGGLWIAGPMTDIRDPHAAKFRHAPYGSLEEWAGVRLRCELPGDPRQFKAKWGKGGAADGSFWYDGLECVDAQPLASFTEGPLKGLAAAARRPMGKGAIVVLGSLPSPKALPGFLLPLLAQAGVKPVAKASENLLVVPRSGAAGEGLVLVEYRNRPASIQLERPATDLLSGKALKKGKHDVERYGVRVLKYA